jgi:predicted Zn finger-like uncharacterized protein
MKFLCPSCKTKYQIADEKVAGRAVRMKCRKCGYVIPISEVPPAPPTVQPPAVAGPLPAVPKAPAPPRGLEPPPSSRPAPRAVDPSASRPAAAPKQVLPKLANPAMATARGVGGPAPQTSAMPKPAIRAVPRVQPAPARAPAQPGVDLLSALDDDEDTAEEQPTAIMRGGALAAAFGALVTAPKPAADAAMPADEWYVGINDVVVGPIRLGELRAKAASGAVQGDSLVWRDGLADWRPLRTVPELVAVVEESLSSLRASGIPMPAPAPAAAADFGTPLPSGITGVGVVTDDLVAAGLTRQRTPVAAWLAIGVALACGIAIGAFFFVKQKPPETIVKYVDRPVPGAEQPAAIGAGEPTPGVAPGADSAGQKPRTGTRSGTKQVAAQEDKGGGLSGLKGLDGLRPGGPGPGSSPGSTTPASGSGGQLDSSQIQSTVSRYTGSVKRSCWQPALDSRDPTAPTSARVSVTITVGPSGNVQNVTTSGEPRGYPGLASCIAGRVRSWQFPATGGTTTANVPFVFAAQ